MSDLDEKLDEALKPWHEEILSEYGTGINDDKKPQFIEFAKAKPQIKQAFKDAGYVKLETTPNQVVIYDTDSPESSYVYRGANRYGRPVDLHFEKLMTGQEFYDRFIKEVDAIDSVTWDDAYKQHMFRAAMMAAGIE